MMDVTEIQEAIEQATKLDKESDDLAKQASKLREQARKACSHPAVKKTSEYDSGSYLDRASTTWITKCAVCGQVLKTHVERHSYYG